MNRGGNLPNMFVRNLFLTNMFGTV